MKNVSNSLIAGVLALLSANCYATWSTLAVDRKTGEIGIVGASCTFDVSGIASIVPGKGAVVVQAGSSYFARMKGVELMGGSATPEEILKSMMAGEFHPESQQYGLIFLNSNTTPLVHSGSEIMEWKGEKVGDDFLVMGNILTGEQVITNTYNAFDDNRDKQLADRLMLALQAGEVSGGDKRCGIQSARSAFLMIYKPEDGAILKLAVQGISLGGKPAVTLLNEQFELWRKNRK